MYISSVLVQGSTLIPILQWEKPRLEEIRDLQKVVQLASDGAST